MQRGQHDAKGANRQSEVTSSSLFPLASPLPFRRSEARQQDDVGQARGIVKGGDFKASGGASGDIAQWQSRGTPLPSVPQRLSGQTPYQPTSFLRGQSARTRPPAKNPMVNIIKSILRGIEGIFPNTPPMTAAITNPWNSVSDDRDTASSRLDVQKIFMEIQLSGLFQLSQLIFYILLNRPKGVFSRSEARASAAKLRRQEARGERLEQNQTDSSLPLSSYLLPSGEAAARSEGRELKKAQELLQIQTGSSQQSPQGSGFQDTVVGYGENGAHAGLLENNVGSPLADKPTVLLKSANRLGAGKIGGEFAHAGEGVRSSSNANQSAFLMTFLFVFRTLIQYFKTAADGILDIAARLRDRVSLAYAAWKRGALGDVAARLIGIDDDVPLFHSPNDNRVFLASQAARSEARTENQVRGEREEERGREDQKNEAIPLRVFRSMEARNGVSEKSLQVNAEISRGRDLRTNRANATGSRFDSGQHRRGKGPGTRQGIFTISSRNTGLSVRRDHVNQSRLRAGLFKRSGNRGTSQLMQRGQRDAKGSYRQSEVTSSSLLPLASPLSFSRSEAREEAVTRDKRQVTSRPPVTRSLSPVTDSARSEVRGNSERAKDEGGEATTPLLSPVASRLSKPPRSETGSAGILPQVAAKQLLGPAVSRSEGRNNEQLQELADHVVNYFRTAAPILRSEAREIVEAGLDRFIPPVEAAIAKYEKLDLLQAQQGYASIEGIGRPAVLRIELSEAGIGAMSDGALRRLVRTMVGSVRANKFIAVRLQIPAAYERRIRDLILLERTNKKDPLKTLPAGADLILYNQGLPENVFLRDEKPSLIIHPDLQNGEWPQLDPREYANQGGPISPENMAEVFTAGLLWISDPLSKQTAEIISQDSRRDFLYRLSSPASLGPLAQIGSWLASTRVTASAA